MNQTTVAAIVASSDVSNSDTLNPWVSAASVLVVVVAAIVVLHIIRRN